MALASLIRLSINGCGWIARYGLSLSQEDVRAEGTWAGTLQVLTIIVEQQPNRRAEDRRTDPIHVVELAPSDLDPRDGDRRQHNRRRGDARSVLETLGGETDGTTVTFTLGATRERQSAVYSCGCVAVDPTTPAGSVSLLQCPTHAALQSKLRRRQTDRL